MIRLANGAIKLGKGFIQLGLVIVRLYKGSYEGFYTLLYALIRLFKP